MKKLQCEMGIIGLGVMGRNLALNIAGHGFPVAVYNRTGEKTRAFIKKDAAGLLVHAGSTLKEFTDILNKPRAVMLMLPAGAPVDTMIQELVPYLEPGDLLIDGGNSHPSDTDRRDAELQGKGFFYLGVGISGGEHGARFGPSIMAGGLQKTYKRIQPIMEAIAARVDGEPCAAYLGNGSAGHFVKMVHNGIEYGLMELIAETYDLMKRGLGLSADELQRLYTRWNHTELEGYLLEITASIFTQSDEKTGNNLIDMIRDKSYQKGSGMWISQEAMNLGVPVPTIDSAISMRLLSDYKDEREVAGKLFAGPSPARIKNSDNTIEQLRNALYTGMIITYAQGFTLLQQASRLHTYAINCAEVTRIWRGGCIIRTALLEKISSAYHSNPSLPGLLVDPHIAEDIKTRQGDLRSVVRISAEAGIPAPGLMASLSYFDGYRSAWLPANLIQAQRDYFGAHTYERVDEPGTFHSEWQKNRGT
ncbi:MAG: NADP-dependent phosphogluconate dehydrogenase [Proteobacteria bacterium]|nr:NADP-dependent phosphogluconate dehydrogenase [Pseudomonadota bacterium]